MSRRKFTDHPALVFYSLIGQDRKQSYDLKHVCEREVFRSVAGNDVCTSSADSEMTPPDVFYKNTLGTLKFFESQLPPGSHVVLIGLIDGGMIYDTMAHRLHPIGQLVCRPLILSFVIITDSIVKIKECNFLPRTEM